LSKEYSKDEFKKPNKAMMMMLRSCDNPNDSLVVVNTQLYHGDELDYVRQGQALFLLQSASKFIRDHNMNELSNKKKMMKTKVKSITQNEKKRINEM